MGQAEIAKKLILVDLEEERLEATFVIKEDYEIKVQALKQAAHAD